MTKLRILREVFRDTSDAANWYGDLEPGLGDKFLNCFRAATQPVGTSPLAHRIAYKNYRRVILQPFPYALYFRLHDDTAVIALVFHTARDPKTLYQVLRNREKSE